MNAFYRMFVALIALAAMGLSTNAMAEKAFAEHKVVLQISDGDPFKQTLVLNVAGNLVKAYGADKVEVEIVAFGPGLRLLFANNANKGRIKSLVESSGVRFAACDNTINNMAKLLGEKPEINASATVVPGGIVRIVELVDQGYVLVKP